MLRVLIFSVCLLSSAAVDVSAQVPAITPGGTVNGASFAAGQAVAPGSLVSIFGTSFGTGLTQASTVPISTSLAGISVTFNNIAAPISVVTAGQLNVQVPYEVGVTGAVNVVVTLNGVPSAPDPVVISPFGPGVFGFNGHAIAIIATDPTDPRYGTLAAPPGSIPGLTTNPAHVGDILLIYATGLGTVTPPVATGVDSKDGLRRTDATPTVLFNSTAGQLFFSGLTPQFPGVYQLNAGVPAIPVGDAIPLQVQIGGITSPPNVTIDIQ